MIDPAIDMAMRLERSFEGLFLKPYLCPAGVPTIGYGHTRGITLASPPITRSLAEQFLYEDTLESCVAVLRVSPQVGTSDARLAALTSFVFNLGIGNYRASTLKRLVNAEEWELAEAQFARWVYGGGRKLPGLVKRRAAEAALFARG